MDDQAQHRTDQQDEGEHGPDAGELDGAEVLDRGGASLGQVREVYLERSTHRPAWVTVTGGEAVGHPATLPVAGTSLDAQGRLVTPYDSATVATAPDAEAGAGRITEEREAAMAEHYGVELPTPGEGPPVPGVTTDDTGHR
jgi:methyl coenzyme M reductase gamma subunit